MIDGEEEGNRMSKMVIGLASGSTEKLLVASTLTGGAVALDIEVHIYLLLGGAYALRKDVAGEGTYADRPELTEEMRAGITDAAVPDPLANLRKLREDGNVHIHVCGTAGSIWGAGELGDFVDICDDIVGIGSYLTDCEEADVVQVL
jgi:peroxiredoxin family protein